jgi:hypothetical protein
VGPFQNCRIIITFRRPSLSIQEAITVIYKTTRKPDSKPKNDFIRHHNFACEKKNLGPIKFVKTTDIFKFQTHGRYQITGLAKLATNRKPKLAGIPSRIKPWLEKNSCVY